MRKIDRPIKTGRTFLAIAVMFLAGMNNSQATPNCFGSQIRHDENVVIRPPTGRPIARPFGVLVNPVSGAASFHNGIDYRVPKLSPIVAGGVGRVVGLGGQSEDRSVAVSYGDRLTVQYAHLENVRVKVGECVRPGRMLARATRRSLHGEALVHVEFRDLGRAVDPLRWLRRESRIVR